MKHHSRLTHLLTGSGIQPQTWQAQITGNRREQIAAPVQFEAMVSERGIAFAPLPGEFLELMGTPEGKSAIARGRGFSAGFKLLRYVRPLMRRLLDTEWAAVRAFDPDLIIHHPKSIAAPHIGEALGRPTLLASLFPGFTPTAAFPSPMLPFASLGPLNRASHVLAIRGADVLFGQIVADWRRASLNLTVRPRRRPSSALYAYSPLVASVPADWGHDVLVSGYWFLDHDRWRPSAQLEAFLNAGAPPVYIGFGSMPGIDPARLAALVVQALAKTGKRGLLATGGGALELANAPCDVHVIAGAPHDRLLPRVSATLHHGGAGTTAASLRAGKPTAICPFFGDQPFWGRRVAQLGVGPPPLDRRTLSVESLVAAIIRMDDPQMRQRAGALGAAIRDEDGVATAVHFIERRQGMPPT